MKYIISLAAALLLLGCSSEQKASEETTEASPAANIVETIQTKTAEVGKHVEEATQAAKEKTQKLVDEAAEGAKKVQESVTDVSQNITEEIAQTSQNIQDNVADTTEKIADELKQTTQEIQEAVATQSAVSEGDGTNLFKRKCASCHGATGEKAALGKSQIIKGWEAGKIITALNGYKEGNYGGAMKGLMASQAASLSQDDIEALAAFLSKQ